MQIDAHLAQLLRQVINLRICLLRSTFSLHELALHRLCFVRHTMTLGANDVLNDIFRLSVIIL